MTICYLAAMTVLSVASGPPQFTITSAYTSHSSGGSEVQFTPAVGDDYRLTVEFDQTGAAQQPYNIHFVMAGQVMDKVVNSLSAGHKKVTTSFSLPLDDKIPYTITVNSGGGGPTKSGNFTPAPPDSIVDRYNPVTIKGWQTTTYNVAGGSYSIEYMSGRPDSDGWQKILTGSSSYKTGPNSHSVSKHTIEGPFVFPVYYLKKTGLSASQLNFRQDFKLEIRAQRVNPDKMRQVKWTDISALKGINVFKHFMEPETVIESNDAKITKFVKDTLGSSYKTKYSPYDAARKMFMAVLKRCTYYYPKEGETDLRPSTAVGMLDKGFGDCGGFSILLVACYRNMGIPARDACGAWVGDDAGHCWCEMWFPSAGWIVSDGSAGNAWSEDGSYAYYFGYVRDLNARFSTMRGNTFKVNNASASWLQGPMWPPVLTGATLSSADGHTHAEVVTASPPAGNYMINLQKGRSLHPKWNLMDLQRRGVHANLQLSR
jgi:hypothetical protein